MQARARRWATLGVVGMVAFLWTAPAEAVFPGAKGRMSGQICVAVGTPQCLMDLRFSPDGSKVVGVRAATQTSGSAIWVANSDGTSARQLVAPDYGDDDPTWAPDGRSVLFVRVVRVDHRCVGNGGSVTN